MADLKLKAAREVFTEQGNISVTRQDPRFETAVRHLEVSAPSVCFVPDRSS